MKITRKNSDAEIEEFSQQNNLSESTDDLLVEATKCFDEFEAEVKDGELVLTFKLEEV